MRTARFAVFVCWIVLLSCPGWARQLSGTAQAASQATGVVEGTVASEAGVGIGNAIVTLDPTGLIEYTDQNGAFAFGRVPAGDYLVIVNVGALEARDADVRVAAGQTVTLTKVLERDFRLTMSTTVSAASKVQEQRLKAPVAITVVDEKTIALEGSAGQIPALLAFTTGAEYTQSGIYDIQFNSRGFNSTLSRRVQVLLDGRDLAAPENKNQEWVSVGFMEPELESVEFVRGPASALYGANSINGVIAMTTRSPRGSPGGRATITTGELGTVIGDVRWAGPLGRDWYTRLVANYTQSGSFAQSRTETVEYPGLPLEVAEAQGDTKARSTDARFDKYFQSGRRLVLETGFSQSDGGTYLSQGGRFNVVDSKRSWSSVELNDTHWTAQAYVNTRNGETQSLFAPAQIITATVQFKGEVQGNRYFDGSKGRVVFGGSYLQEHTDSANDAGVQTLYEHPVTTKAPALYGQLDYDLSSKVKVVSALRWDDSTLHSAQWSPKAALVYTPASSHSLHVSYNSGFEVGNYNELFVHLPLAPPLDFSAIDAAFAPFLGGVPLGFASVPIYAIGNPNLDVEKVKSVEIGYVASLSSRARISVDVYRNSMRDFISDIVPGINPAYPPYSAPASVPAPLRTIIETTVNTAIPGLTNLPNGYPQIVYSLGNVGLVTSRGVELEGVVRPQREWSVDASYTRFDFTIVEAPPGLEPKPNAPRNRVTFGTTYTRLPFAVSFHHRWVDAFTWASGLFVGPVPSYHVSDVNASYGLTKRVELGANVSNVFNQRHYEMFGGDILGRRALARLSVGW
jgi:outer membrane receptor protein involved in Fe transport